MMTSLEAFRLKQVLRGMSSVQRILTLGLVAEMQRLGPGLMLANMSTRSAQGFEAAGIVVGTLSNDSKLPPTATWQERMDRATMECAAGSVYTLISALTTRSKHLQPGQAMADSPLIQEFERCLKELVTAAGKLTESGAFDGEVAAEAEMAKRTVGDSDGGPQTGPCFGPTAEPESQPH